MKGTKPKGVKAPHFTDSVLSISLPALSQALYPAGILQITLLPPVRQQNPQDQGTFGDALEWR